MNAAAPHRATLTVLVAPPLPPWSRRRASRRRSNASCAPAGDAHDRHRAFGFAAAASARSPCGCRRSEPRYAHPRATYGARGDRRGELSCGIRTGCSSSA